VSLDLVRWGTDRLRVGSWRGDSRTAYIAPLADGAPAATDAVRRCCTVLGERGYETAITAALGPAESRGFIEAGFDVRERLHLLAHDLHDLAPVPPSELRRGRRSDRPAALVVDGRSFDAFWRLDDSGFEEALGATPSSRFRVATRDEGVVGYAISGVMHIAMDDGLSVDIPAGSAFDIPAGHDAWVVGRAPWVAVVWNSLRSYALPPINPAERVLATVVFTDIVESTATLERIGDAAWRDLLIAHNERLRDDLNVFRGREVTTTGDGFLAVFDSASRAVECANAMSSSAQAMGLQIRVGVHTGEVEFVGSNVRGVAVHAALRVMSQAGPNEVLVSSTTADLLEGAGLRLTDAGSHKLKGLGGERRLFRSVA